MTSLFYKVAKCRSNENLAMTPAGKLFSLSFSIFRDQEMHGRSFLFPTECKGTKPFFKVVFH
jgi:hypothetical protein